MPFKRHIKWHNLFNLYFLIGPNDSVPGKLIIEHLHTVHIRAKSPHWHLDEAICRVDKRYRFSLRAKSVHLYVVKANDIGRAKRPVQRRVVGAI